MHQVLFYKTESDNEVVLDFIREQPPEDRKVIGEDLKTLQFRYPMGLPLCRPIGLGLWELRSSLPSKREARLIYFFDSKRQMILVVHGFIKKTRTTPNSDIKLAEKRKAEFG